MSTAGVVWSNNILPGHAALRCLRTVYVVDMLSQLIIAVFVWRSSAILTLHAELLQWWPAGAAVHYSAYVMKLHFINLFIQLLLCCSCC